jgi:lipoprotein signal peptidase
MSTPDTLLLKILLVPALIATVTLVGRRYGQRVGGWLGSFPIVAGPILFILSFENGVAFGAAAAQSAFAAIAPAMIFYVVYARLAVRSVWWFAAGIGIVIWLLVAFL